MLPNDSNIFITSDSLKKSIESATDKVSATMVSVSATWDLPAKQHKNRNEKRTIFFMKNYSKKAFANISKIKES